MSGGSSLQLQSQNVVRKTGSKEASASCSDLGTDLLK